MFLKPVRINRFKLFNLCEVILYEAVLCKAVLTEAVLCKAALSLRGCPLKGCFLRAYEAVLYKGALHEAVLCPLRGCVLRDRPQVTGKCNKLKPFHVASATPTAAED